jgi:hypothetical protein
MYLQDNFTFISEVREPFFCKHFLLAFVRKTDYKKFQLKSIRVPLEV